MKIEMGESLIYSWLRHIHNCQIVQTNWTASTGVWNLLNRDELKQLMKDTNLYFYKKYGYGIYKNNSSLEQLLQQAEIDVIGMSFVENASSIVAVDIAFHEFGLNYGSKEETVQRVIKKCLRSVMCLLGYFGHTGGKIIFASPKINNATMNILLPCIDDMNELLKNNNISYEIELIANEDFNFKILQPVVNRISNISDTNELFVRSVQMLNLFSKNEEKYNTMIPKTSIDRDSEDYNIQVSKEETNSKKYLIEEYKNLKIGKLAQTVIPRILNSDKITDEEIKLVQDKDYSKETFDLQFPLLVEESNNFEKIRYYSNPIIIKGKYYYLCSQWYETSANNDRLYLEKWVLLHS